MPVQSASLRIAMPRLVIDDLEIEVPEGTKVIEAAERLGIMIPRFCYHKALGSAGACRMCAVKFIHGPFKGLQMSCMIDAQDGMVVSTTDEEAVAFRRQVIEWLMMNHPHDCPVCDEGGQCLLQDETVSGGHGLRRYPGRKRTYHDQYLGEFIAHEMNRCIHCYRCSRFYQDFAGYRDLGPMQIANRVYFGRFRDGPLESPFAGNLVDICPTGVYTDRSSRYKARRWDLQRVPFLCIHCSLGCSTVASARYREVVRIEARFNKSVNGHFICDRGRFGYPYANLAGRPRRARVDGEDASLAEAVRAASGRLDQISMNAGPDAVALVASDRCSLETLAVLKRISREKGWTHPAVFPRPDLEHKTRRAVSRLDRRLAVSMRELESADFILAVGIDPVHEAPMLALALRQAFREDAGIVVMDPRPVSAPFDFEHVAIAPAEIGGCLSRITEALSALQADSAAQGKETRRPEAAGPLRADLDSRIAGIVERLKGSRNPVIVCGTDIVRDSTPDRAADLALLLLQLKGRPCLFFVLPGPNSFGAVLLAESPGRSFSDVVQDIEQGKVKALLVVESDPFKNFPDRERLERALDRLDLLAAMDYLPTSVVGRAHIVLPTCTVFERGGSFINQEGRVQRVEPVHEGGVPVHQVSGGGHPPRVFSHEVPGGEIEAAWRTAVEVAGYTNARDNLSILKIMAEEHPGFARCRDIPTSRSFRVLPDAGDRPPVCEETGDGAAPEAADTLEVVLVDRFFGTEELSGYSPVIQNADSEPLVFLHVRDAEPLGIAHSDWISIALEGGGLEVRAGVSAQMAEGVLVIPRHRLLEWQKLGPVPARIPFGRISKAGKE
jgi:NADH-quinone oxidoreductase subunit G